jgi:spore germination cell wall hydrolase CwlJ-like protein
MRRLDKVLVVILLCGSNIAYAPTTATDPHTACLASTLYHEARGEPYVGKLWVAAVVLNRVKSAYYPNTVCDVVYDPHQFPWTKDPHTYDDPHYDLAQSILSNKTILPKTKATHFHNLTVHPNWKHLVPIKTIKNHVFYEKKAKRSRSTTPREFGMANSVSKTKPK